MPWIATVRRVDGYWLWHCLNAAVLALVAMAVNAFTERAVRSPATLSP